MAVPYNQVSRDAQLALNEFSSEFAEAFASVPPESNWSAQLGMLRTSDSIRTTYPIPLDAAGYREFKGDQKFRTLYERSLSMTTKQWQDGVEIEARKVEAGDFVGWDGAPGNIAAEGARQPNLLVAALLNANPYLDLYREEYDGGAVASAIRLFASNHPFNVLDASVGTFDNDRTYSEVGEALVVDAFTHFRSLKAPNGRHRRSKLTTFLIPPELEWNFKKFLESDLLLKAVQNVAATENVGGFGNTNVFKGTVNYVVAEELSEYSTTTLYALDATSMAKPWVVQTKGAPEEIRFDKDSDHYKKTLKIAVSYILDMAAAAALPYAIARYTVA